MQSALTGERETDRDLIHRYIDEGDNEAFAALVLRHTRTMRSVLLAVLNGNLSDMEEVEQEVLLALCGALPRFEYRSSFSTWFYRFCRNRAIDFVRKRGTERRRAEIVRQRLALDNSDPAALRAGDPEQTVLYKEQKERVHRALAALKERDRTILVLKDMDGLSMDEIAIILHVPVGTIKSRLHRARKKVAAIMEKMV